MDLFLHNSLTRRKEKFEHVGDVVTMYACGPTVYDIATIGNLRTYVLADVLYRTLLFAGHEVEYVMNITDVGHLVSDADEGEDKMQKAVQREGLSMWELASKYMGIFLRDVESLNLVSPHVLARATDHIQEQISLIQTLEKQGFTYKTSDGIYFDTSLLQEYGTLSDLDHEHIDEGARVTANPEKRNPTDFALWKFHQGTGKREMEWESPWGVGFPGWHIECSAMSLKYLANAYQDKRFVPDRATTIDIHLGGEDLKMTHHPNEIAQSEAATGVPFVHYWVHGAFLLINDQKISKSKGNIVALDEIKNKGILVLALRYLYFSTHYRKQANFTWDALLAAEKALFKIYVLLAQLKTDPTTVDNQYLTVFQQRLSDDLNMPEALAVLWDLVKDTHLNEGVKLATLFKLDEVLGFKFKEVWTSYQNLPEGVLEKVAARESLRAEKNYQKADSLRAELDAEGYRLLDTEEGPVVFSKKVEM